MSILTRKQSFFSNLVAVEVPSPAVELREILELPKGQREGEGALAAELEHHLADQGTYLEKRKRK